MTNLPPDPNQPPAAPQPPGPPNGAGQSLPPGPPAYPAGQPGQAYPPPGQPGQPYTPPGQPGQPYTPPPGGQVPPPRKRRTGLIIGLVVVALLALCGIGTGIALLGSNATEKAQDFAKSIGELKEGDCVKPAGITDQYLGSSCSSKDTIGKVSKVFPGTEANSDQQNCPPDSDLLLGDAGKIICVKSTTSEKLGQPGKGGGIVVSGDCIGDEGELACTDPKAGQKVAARVPAIAACAAPALRYIDMEVAPTPILCLLDGPGFAAPGECIASLTGAVSLVQTPCGPTTPKVLARKPTQAACESVPGMTHWLEDQQGLPAAKFICVKQA